jgi:hypothetical protein
MTTYHSGTLKVKEQEHQKRLETIIFWQSLAAVVSGLVIIWLLMAVMYII